MTTAIIEAKLLELGYTDPEDPSGPDSIANDAKAIASALADARRADVETVRAVLGGGTLCDHEGCACSLKGETALAALSRLAGET